MVIKKIESNLKEYKLISKGERILVCVSGGSDSIFLLHVLKQMQKKYNLKLFIAHVNHNLRSKESDAEEAFVRELSLKLKIPFYKCSVQTKLYASQEKLSIEEAARNLRYNFFKNICHVHGINKIFLAHTKDDQVETIIMRLIRGAGIKGLSGMSFESCMGELKLIRPMLDVEKIDILNYLKKNKIKYKVDSSNLKTDYFRNKVRLKIIPMLKEFSPRINENIFRLSVTAKQIDDIMQEKVKKLFSKIVNIKNNKLFCLNKSLFLNLPFVLRSEVIRKIIGGLKGDLNGIDFKHVKIADDFINDTYSKGKHLDLPKAIFLKKARKIIYFGEKEIKTVNNPKIPARKLYLGKKLKLPELNLCIEAVSVEGNIKRCNLKKHPSCIEFLDFDTLNFPLQVRLREKGDLFHPIGAKGKKKLKKFLIDNKIEDNQKDCTGLLVSNGIIAWVIGLRLGDAFKVTKKTKQIVKIQAKKLKTARGEV